MKYCIIGRLDDGRRYVSKLFVVRAHTRALVIKKFSAKMEKARLMLKAGEK